MADIFSVEPPRWLQEMTASNDKGLLGGILGEVVGGGLIAASKVSDEAKQAQGGLNFGERATHWFKDLPQSIAEAHLSVLDPMWKIKVQQGQLKIAETGLALQEMQQKISLNASELQAQAEDTRDIPAWMQTHNTPASRLTAEDRPTPKSKKWQEFMYHMDQADTAQARAQAQSVIEKSAVNGIKELSDSITEISKYDGVKAGVLSAKVRPFFAKGELPPADVLAEIAQAREGAETKKFGQTKELIGLRGTGTPVGARYLNMADQEDAVAEDFRLKGDTASYQSHRARADEYRALAQPRVSTTEVTTDPSGRTTVTASTGPKPTAAMSTRAQENIAKYEDATVLINQLQRSLDPKDVGAAGLIGEWVLDRTLPQFGADRFFSGARVEKRVALGALRETLLRTVSNDPRFSNVDRQVISELLPSTGVFESYPDAMARLTQVKGMLADRARTYANAAKMPLPDFAKTPEDMASEYNATLQQLKDAVAQKRMTPDQAYQQAQKLYQGMTNAVERFHK